MLGGELKNGSQSEMSQQQMPKRILTVWENPDGTAGFVKHLAKSVTSLTALKTKLNARNNFPHRGKTLTMVANEAVDASECGDASVPHFLELIKQAAHGGTQRILEDVSFLQLNPKSGHSGANWLLIDEACTSTSC